MKKEKHPALKMLYRYIILFAGAVVAAVGLEIFLIPNNIIDGGIVGVSIISSYLTNIPLGIFTFALNVPFLIVGYKQIGKTFLLSIFVCHRYILCFCFHPTAYSRRDQRCIAGNGVRRRDTGRWRRPDLAQRRVTGRH